MCLDANQAIAHQKGETRCKIDEICFGSNVRAISIYEEAGEDTGCSFVALRANVQSTRIRRATLSFRTNARAQT